MAKISVLDDEYCLESPDVRAFIGEVRGVLEASATVADALQKLRTPFSVLLRSGAWLPTDLAKPGQGSGMGGRIGTYLLFRAADKTLSLSALVVPAREATPVHDHLAWGLVGLYRGEQNEEVYRRVDEGETDGVAQLELVESRHLAAGDFYDLIPPHGDIHRVVSASDDPSISLHLLGTDVGCIHRHTFDPDASLVKDFRSGYLNVSCPEERE